MSKGKVLIYLGAHDGGSLSGIVNDFERIYAFEAHPENVSRLKTRFSASKNLSIIWAAVTDTEEPGSTTFHLSSNNCSSSIGKFKEDWLKDRTDGLRMTHEVKVPTLNLRKFCQEKQIEEIDSYVSDIQGADWMVLKTMEKPYLANGWIKSIQTETTKDGKQNIYSSLPTNELSAFRTLLQPYNYKLTSTGWGLLEPGIFTPVADDWWEFDALWQLQPPSTLSEMVSTAPTTTTVSKVVRRVLRSSIETKKTATIEDKLTELRSTMQAKLATFRASSNNSWLVGATVKEGTVYCEVAGGLGNQLFMISAALSYATATNRECWFRRTWVQPTQKPVVRASYWHNLLIDIPQMIESQWSEKVKSATTHSDLKPGFRSIPLLKDNPEVLLSGYFQSPKYFNHNINMVKDRLFPISIQKYATLLFKEMTTSSDTFAFMHFRRGDYKHLQYAHNILPISYYEQASTEFGKHVTFLVFCEAEDVDQIKREIRDSPVLSKREFVWVDTRIPDYIQLLVMSNCQQGGIVANSSFSVWAAYLQPIYNVIVAPKIWSAIPEESNTADLCLQHWTRI